MQSPVRTPAIGAQAAPPFPVGDPNFLTVFGPGDEIGVIHSRQGQNVWLIGGLFGHVPADPNCDGAFNAGDIDAFFACLDAGGCP